MLINHSCRSGNPCTFCTGIPHFNIVVSLYRTQSFSSKEESFFSFFSKERNLSSKKKQSADEHFLTSCESGIIDGCSGVLNSTILTDLLKAFPHSLSHISNLLAQVSCLSDASLLSVRVNGELINIKCVCSCLCVCSTWVMLNKCVCSKY